MDKNGKDFLFELLNTPSPSGDEAKIQKKWLEYNKEFCDKVDSDLSGNAIGIINPDADFKILLAGHADEICFIVTAVEENGFIRFDKVGGISPKIAPGMKVNIYGKETLKGVIGVTAEHHGGLADKFEIYDLYIDTGANEKKDIEDKVQIGDFIVYDRGTEALLNDKIAGRGLDNRTGSFIVSQILRKLSEKKPQIGVYGVSTVNEETNMGGAYFASAKIEPDCAIAIDVTFATDYPGVNTTKYGNIKLGGGPVLAKGAPVHIKLNDLLVDAAKRLEMETQLELVPFRTGTDADRIRLTGTGVPTALASLPLRYMHSPVETVSLKDIDGIVDLLVEMIVNMTGKEDLRPVTV